jgi:hypothetical protein
MPTTGARWLASGSRCPSCSGAVKSHGCQVVTNDRDLIQFRHEEVTHYIYSLGICLQNDKVKEKTRTGTVKPFQKLLPLTPSSRCPSTRTALTLSSSASSTTRTRPTKRTIAMRGEGPTSRNGRPIMLPRTSWPTIPTSWRSRPTRTRGSQDPKSTPRERRRAMHR